VPETSELERQLHALGVELHKLEGEYTMYFSGRAVRPPNETRARVEAAIRRLDRAGFDNATQRFRFGNLQARFTTLAELWDRGMRAKEEGRPGPFTRSHQAPPPAAATEHPAPAHSTDRVVSVVAFSEPAGEPEKLHKLYDTLMDARRETGQPVVPFHRFAELVREQVEQLRGMDQAPVAFQVAVKDGRVNLTARVLREERG